MCFFTIAGRQAHCMNARTPHGVNLHMHPTHTKNHTIRLHFFGVRCSKATGSLITYVVHYVGRATGSLLIHAQHTVRTGTCTLHAKTCDYARTFLATMSRCKATGSFATLTLNDGPSVSPSDHGCHTMENRKHPNIQATRFRRPRLRRRL